MLSRYVCRKCNKVVEGDILKSIYIDCPECHESLLSSPFFGGVVGNTLYKGLVYEKSYTVPEGVEEIEPHAFENSELEEVFLPKTLKTIGSSAFESCRELKSINIPDSVTSIGFNSFKDCISLEHVTIGKSVKTITGFSGCWKIKRIEIPDSATKIDGFAFSDCINLISISIPDSVTEIDMYAFYNCKSLTSVFIPNSVTEIGENAFENCESLTSVFLPDSVKAIHSGTFYGCDNLTYINIPENVRKLEGSNFGYHTLFDAAYIPKSINSITRSWFYASIKDITIYVVPGSYAHTFIESEGVMNETKFVDKIRGKMICDNVVIGEGTESIPGYAFDNTGIKRIQFPKSLKTINEYAFVNCPDLTNLEFPPELTKIGQCAFAVDYENDAIKRLSFPAGLVTIGDNAFHGRKIQSIRFEGGIKEIGAGAFSDAEIDKIDLPETVKKISLDSFGENTIVMIGREDVEVFIKRKEIHDIDEKELKVINDLRSTLDEKQGILNQTNDAIVSLTNQINEKGDTLAEKKDYIETFVKKKIAEAQAFEKSIQSKHDAITTELRSTISDLTKDAASLEKQLSSTFILSFSKKNDLRTKIALRKKEISENSRKLNNAYKRANIEIEQAKKDTARRIKEKEELTKLCHSLSDEIKSTKDRKDSLDSEVSLLSKEIESLKDKIVKAEEEHSRKSIQRDAELLVFKDQIKQKREKKERDLEETRIRKEKSDILKVFNPKIVLKKDLKYPVIKHSNPDEVLLNEGYLKLIDCVNSENRFEIAKKTIKENKDKLSRLFEINHELGLEDNDGIDPMFFAEKDVSNPAFEFFPNRISQLCDLFSKNEEWTDFKRTINSLKHSIKSSNSHERYFGNCDAAVANCKDNSVLVFLPFCIICFDVKGPKITTDMSQVFYDQAIVSYEYEEFENDKVETNCEEIGNRWLHQNKDGSKNLRYKNNPMIYILRSNSVIIKNGSKKYEIKVSSKSIAEDIVESFRSFANSLNDFSYDGVKQFKELDEIKNSIESNIQERKNRLELEEAKLKEEEEKAEHEAKEKRQKLIAKQRERNEEKRFHEIEESERDAVEAAFLEEKEALQTEKRTGEKGDQVFPEVAEALRNKSASGADLLKRGLILIDESRTLYNNIISLEFMYDSSGLSENSTRSVFMTDEFGDVISEIYTLSVKNGEKYRVPIVLNKNGLDSNENYYLAVNNSELGLLESLTEFRICIAFSNDFDF